MRILNAHWYSFIAAVTALIASTTSASTQSALPPAVDAFVASANALAKSAAEPVDLGRATARLDELRTQLTNKLLAQHAGSQIKISFDEQALLCEPRVANIEPAARRNYIQAVSGKVEEVGKPSKLDNLQSALKSLFIAQNLDITIGIPNAAELAKAKERVRDRCQADLKSYDTAYFGKGLIPQEPQAAAAPAALPVFAAVGALIDVINSIITPAIVEGATIVDEQRRRAAVLTFLHNAQNRKAIEDSGVGLAKTLSTFTWHKRLKLAGSVVEKAALLRSVSVDLKGDDCKAFVNSGNPLTDDKKRVSDDFVLCWRSAWNQIQDGASSLLKAAEEYDQLADAGDTDNAAKAFEPLAKSLEAVDNPDTEGLLKFWNWATRLLGFAQKVEAAFSKDNREKLHKAIDDLVKAM